MTIVKEHLPQVVTISKSLDFLPRAIEVSLREGIPVYDSLYIELAETKGSKLVIAGMKQHEVTKKYVDAELL